MKNLRTTLLFACTMLYSLYSVAQTHKLPINEPDYRKPKLFNNLPDIIPVSMDNLDNLINAKAGVSVATNLSTSSKMADFKGKVISAVNQYDERIQSVVIRSTNFNGATLTISKIIKDDGTATFTGRLISFQHGDAYILQKQQDGFVLVKKNFYDLVNE